MPVEFRGKHKIFLEDTTRQIDLEGARYSGKSWVCAAKVILSCLAHPGIFWLACRYSNETTRTMLRPLIQRMASMYGVSVTWQDDESCFLFPEVDGKTSKIYCYGLKSQSIVEALSKVRGAEYAGLWNDQSEELPQQIAEELPFCTRQPGYPHQVIFSPNPPTEDHYLTDMFPEENPFENRVYYCLSLYDNQHNLADGKIKELEDQFPPTHAKYKSLIMGQRGPNVVGAPIYDGLFTRARHVGPITVQPGPILEAFDVGKHHPVWMIAQRQGERFVLLGGIMGKRMFLEDFLPVVEAYRKAWCGDDPVPEFKTCCDPPPALEGGGLRYTHINILREAGFRPRWRANANAPDVRESTIQHAAALMRRQIARHAAGGYAFVVNQDPQFWLMKSAAITKQTKLFIDGLEGSYVWSENLISVGNKKMREPKTDQWVDGWQRCMENMVLNFSAGKPVIQTAPVPEVPESQGISMGKFGWMGS